MERPWSAFPKPVRRADSLPTANDSGASAKAEEAAQEAGQACHAAEQLGHAGRKNSAPGWTGKAVGAILAPALWKAQKVVFSSLQRWDGLDAETNDPQWVGRRPVISMLGRPTSGD